MRLGFRHRRLVGVALASASLVVVGPADADEKENELCANAAEDAQGLQREGKLTQAREKLVLCARASCPAFIRKDCTGWLTDVDKSMPSIVVRATDGKSRDLAEVRVSVDGKVVAERLDGRAIAIDPGDHVVRYDAPSYAPLTEKILVRQGEANRLVTVTLRQNGGSDAAAPAAPTGGVPLASWILGGAGIALAATGGVFWGIGRSDHGSLEDGCARTRSCLQDDVDSAKTKLLIGDIAVGAGLVAIGAAVVLAVLNGKKSSAEGARLRVVGAPNASGSPGSASAPGSLR